MEGEGTGLDLGVLSDLGNRRFMTVLRSVPEILTSGYAGVFYETVLSHFDQKLVKAKGSAILSVICQILSSGSFTNQFTAKGMWKKLPYGRPEFSDGVFDILMILIVQKPCFATKEFAEELFVQQIPLNPMKALTILARYAQKFYDMQNPFWMLDLLITNSEHFATQECGIQYLSLLTYMYRQYKTFREYRGKYCWLKTCEMLKLENTEVLKFCYSTLFSVSNTNKAGLLPIKEITLHLNNPELTDCVLPLLIVWSEHINEDEIMRILLKLARTNDKATLVLLKLCRSVENAAVLMDDDSWINTPLPSLLDTLKIVFAVMAHKTFRRKMSNNPHLVRLLKMAAENAKHSNLSMLFGIVKRMTLTEEIINNMAKRGVFGAFLTSADECDSEIADKALFRTFEVIARNGFVLELIEVCRLAIREVDRRGTLDGESIRFLEACCTHQQCRSVMISMNIIEICTGLVNDTKLSVYARKIVDVMNQIKL